MGLVIHEMVSVGLPLLVTNNYGVNTMFVINNFNSLLFEPNSSVSLFKLNLFDSLSNEEVEEMGKNSKHLSIIITSEISSASLMSVMSIY